MNRFALALIATAAAVTVVSTSLAGHARLAGSNAAQATASDEAFQKPLDEVVDLYVRDGYVYYQALKSSRTKLDRYVASLDAPSVATQLSNWPRERQMAFWINAYNAWVLRTVIDNYPIHGRIADYPSDSLRQVPGAFDRVQRRMAGRALTLDAIERQLGSFNDPRVYFALGRGAVGSGRLRSEAYTAGRLEEQLKSVAAEVPTRPRLVEMNRDAKQLSVSPIFGWHEAEFIATYANASAQVGANRAPIERAILGFLVPNLTQTEAEFVKQPDVQIKYLPFDWHLNDLATRR